jgi:hypothetical protein
MTQQAPAATLFIWPLGIASGGLGWAVASVVCLVLNGLVLYGLFVYSLYIIREGFQHPSHPLAGFQPPRRSSRRKGS